MGHLAPRTQIASRASVAGHQTTKTTNAIVPNRGVASVLE
jgi:hypothetical protein